MTPRTKYEIGMSVFWTVACVFFFTFGLTVPAVVLLCLLPFRYTAAAIIIHEEGHHVG